MTYGPQKIGGPVPQRFGPINSDVGWRRLNVLFTRAKKRMHVFSSMDSGNVLISNTSKKGVSALRDFLVYMETGNLIEISTNYDKPPDSDFEIAVIDALEKQGFSCMPQVGVAGFFIDIGVLDPGLPGQFLMGIECDGATYHSAKSVRDRDRLRQQVLENLGWRIRRIWSTDWFKSPETEIESIINELNVLKTEITINIEPESVVQNSSPDDKQDEENFSDLEFNYDGLKERLLYFDENVIRKKYPNTSENKRILRSAMIEAFIEYEPMNKREFLEYIPRYLREATDSKEGKYLNQILNIIDEELATI